MRLDSAGWPFIGGALALAVVSAALVGWPLAVPLAALARFFAFFFRDPERASDAPDAAVLSPADGRVLVAGPAVASAANGTASSQPMAAADTAASSRAPPTNGHPAGSKRISVKSRSGRAGNAPAEHAVC